MVIGVVMVRTSLAKAPSRRLQPEAITITKFKFWLSLNKTPGIASGAVALDIDGSHSEKSGGTVCVSH
jgi:hypothetical protein